MIRELTAAQTRRSFDPGSLGFKTTSEVTPHEGIIGQDRAVSSLKFGLGIRDDGFNIYVAGPPGIGKMTAVQVFAGEMARQRPTPDDWCYVYNFDDPYRPRVCRLPAGQGRRLQHDMRALIEHVRSEVPKAFESEDYTAKRDEIIKQFDKGRATVFEELGDEVTQAGFALQATQFGIILIPVLGGRPLNEKEFRDLPEQARADIDSKRESLQDRLKAAMRQVRDIARGVQKSLQELNERVAFYIVGGLIDDLLEKSHDLPDVVGYLQSVLKDLVENIESFRDESGGGAAASAGGLQEALLARRMRELPLRKYQVNVVIDNSKQEGAPVVTELNPTFGNLFGRIEKETELGVLSTDFTMVRGGSLHRANGGVLVISVEDLLRDSFAWDALRRALRSREIQIEELGDRLGLFTTKSVRPFSIPLDVKVILVGRSLWYYLLHAYDESFPELFKVKADFDTRVTRNDADVREFLGVLRGFCDKEGIRPLDSAAVAKLLEHSSRLAEDQEKLSTHLGLLADLLRESQYWADQANSAVIGVEHVRKAVQARVYRAGLMQERIQEMIARGTLLIATKGLAAGQANGLSVLSLGDASFGKPSRITATVAPGREGVVDIEREVELGGPIHSKGVLILNGYLAQQYAQDEPLSLAARLVFEQSYEGVEGDSASSAELYALLSAISGVPLRQGIGVTGSVNQHGEIQAIGGVNEKIEGFYDVCRAMDLTGDQGVLIPASNATNLMLREDVVSAIEQGRFHVWTAEKIDEGIELLTGMPAGERLPDGEFLAGTINFLVRNTLRGYAEAMRRNPELEEEEPGLPGS